MTAADRPSVTDNARAEAERRWPRLYGPEETLTYPREAVREHTRGGFVAGYKAGWAAGRAEAWDEGYQDGLRQGGEGEDGPRYVNPYRAAGRAETTTATDEDAARVRAQIAVLLTQHAQSVLAREGMFDSDETSEAVDAILALLATARAETTTATTEDVVEDAYRLAYDAMRHHPGIWHNSLRAAVEALADAGLLARPLRDGAR